METIIVPPAWRELDLASLAGTLMVIGTVNSGKSTFVRWLAAGLVRRHAKVGWLDADMGQSTLGVPATMNLALLESGKDLPTRPAAVFFTGSTSPQGHMLPTLAGVQLLKERALALGAGAVVVDTSGLVEKSAGGGALKEWKIALLRPTTVFALQQERELEHILGPLRREKALRLHLLPVAEAVRPRSQAQRAERRRRQFADYFARGRVQQVAIRHLPVYGLEMASAGRLVSLRDRDGFSLALGLLRAVLPGRVLEILTPLPEMSRVTGVRVGDLSLAAETGEELG